MSIPLSFFMDEVRNKFYISTQLKQAWAAELMVLSEIDRVCRKHGIRYFADWGTMLGAIRHGGFVPWDDDLDICMTRDQYNRFVNEAAKDLPDGYWLIDYASDKDHWHFVAGVANRMELFGFDEVNMTKYHNYPYTANIDIFIMDYLYTDEEEEKKRRDELVHLMAVAKSIIEGTFTPDKIQFYLSEIEENYGVSISPELDSREMGVEIYRVIDQVMSRVTPGESNEVGEVDLWILMGHKGYCKTLYEKAVRIPFEFTEMPVQFNYNRVMRQHYGNYLEVRKGAGLHEYPCFLSQIEKLKELMGVDKLPEFQFDDGRLTRNSLEGTKKEAGALKVLSAECLWQMEIWQEEVEKCLFSDVRDAQKLLVDCQQIAMDFGTLTERIKGEGNSVTASLERYCESLYQLYEAISGQEQTGSYSKSKNERIVTIETCMKRWQEDYIGIKESVQSNIVDRTSVVFLPTHHERWIGFQTLYEKAVQDDNCDVYVVPLPLIKKDSEGRLTNDMLYEPGQYSEEIPIHSYKEFDISLCYPDVVYIQDTYDNENPLLSIPRKFFSSILRENCGKLVYVPWFEVDDFEQGAICETFNLSILLKTPGIMNADEIWAQSETMRQRYIEILTEYVGEKTKEIWEKKIISRQLPVNEFQEKWMQEHATTQKNILYCIGVNELSENSAKKNMFDKIRERFETFEKASEDGINVTVTFYPRSLEEWEHVDQSATAELDHIVEQYKKNSWCKVDTDSEAKQLAMCCDAYYGEPTPLVLMFKEMGKPVMIAMEAD